MKQKIICIIMGGGRGKRLHPLTTERCKPAVPIAGKYRLVDIPISNCLNSGLNRIYVLSQFNTASLHQHIQETYKFDSFGGGSVDILSAEQTMTGDNWYQGTADAVRQNLRNIGASDTDLVLILSGDQLYQMNFQSLIRQHEKSGSELTIAARPMPTSKVAGLGLMRVNDSRDITAFVEKPTDHAVIDSLKIGESLTSMLKAETDEHLALANMGIYLFNASILKQSLDNTLADFGKEVIPQLLGQIKMSAYLFEGYWEDIGTVRSFFEANLSLTDPLPPFNFFDEENRIYTRARHLPAAKINSCHIDRAIIAGASIITNSKLEHCVIGVRSSIGSGTILRDVVMMGADYFENGEVLKQGSDLQLPAIGIGENCLIESAIIDKNARIGNNVTISPMGKENGFCQGDVMVRDGVAIIQKNAILYDNTIF